jgi:hypothetical protein
MQIPEQSVNPVGQVHLLAEQSLPPVHFRPQLPQLLESLVRFTHKPEQTVWPVGQLMTQRLLKQIWPEAHLLAHLPQ